MSSWPSGRYSKVDQWLISRNSAHNIKTNLYGLFLNFGIGSKIFQGSAMPKMELFAEWSGNGLNDSFKSKQILKAKLNRK